MRPNRLLAVLVAGWLLAGAGWAELPDGFNHPEVSWQEFDTDHFTIVYNAGLERTAALAGAIAEQIHPRVCELLGTEPKSRTTVVLADYDDVGVNNFAQRMQHVIFLYNPVVNQARTDRRSWLTSLLTHEYTHVVNGWALRAGGGTYGALSEWSGMEYQPQWFTEGLAEYVAHDGRQEPVLYALQAAHQGELLDSAKLDVADMRFDVIETATVYRQGHAMVNYLVERFGQDVIARLLKRAGGLPQWDLAFRAVTGTSTRAFTRDALAKIRAEAGEASTEAPADAASEPLPTAGLTAALAASPSPDGKWLAVYGIEDWEEPIAGLWLYDRATGRRREVDRRLDMYASWRLSWSPGSDQLVYVVRVRNRRGSVVNDVLSYDLATGHKRSLTAAGWRLGEAVLSPDGRQLAATAYHDERVDIAVMPFGDGEPKLVTAGLRGDSFSPSWSPDGAQLAFSLATSAGTDLAVIDVDGQNLRLLTNDPEPDQYPAWSPDGQSIAFVSYRQSAASAGAGRSAAVAAEAEGLSGTGTNVYVIGSQGGQPRQLTTATSGGVYYPAWLPDSRSVAVSLFRIRDAAIWRVPVPMADPNQPSEVPNAVATVGSLDQPPAPPAFEDSAPPRVVAAGRRDALPTGPAADIASGEAVADGHRYRAATRFKPYVVRPYQVDDGLGSAYGLRAQAADPLKQHQVMGEVQYGWYSEKVGAQAQYRNDQTVLGLSANVYKRVPPYRGERGLLVAETEWGVRALADWPLTVARNAFAKDKLRFGFQAAHHSPFATAGGILRPAPQDAWVVGPLVALERTQLLPGRGLQEMRAELGLSRRELGADLNYVQASASYVGRYFAPNPRNTVNLAGLVTYFSGDGYARTAFDQTIGLLELRYESRLADELLGGALWPAVQVGPVYLDAGYQLRALLGGSGSGVDDRDQLTVSLRNNGLLTRHFTYDLNAGNRTYIGSGGGNEWFIQAKVGFRAMPY